MKTLENPIKYNRPRQCPPALGHCGPPEAACLPHFPSPPLPPLPAPRTLALGHGGPGTSTRAGRASGLCREGRRPFWKVPREQCRRKPAALATSFCWPSSPGLRFIHNAVCPVSRVVAEWAGLLMCVGAGRAPHRPGWAPAPGSQPSLLGAGTRSPWRRRRTAGRPAPPRLSSSSPLLSFQPRDNAHFVKS